MRKAHRILGALRTLKAAALEHWRLTHPSYVRRQKTSGSLMKRNPSNLARVVASAAILCLLAACGSSAGSSAAAPVTPQAVKGVQTPSQISVVTAK